MSTDMLRRLINCRFIIIIIISADLLFDFDENGKRGHSKEFKK